MIQSRCSDGHLPELEGAAHPCGRADFAVVGHRSPCARLAAGPAKAPGLEQRVQRPAVEETNDAALDQNADEARNHEGERNGDREANSRTAPDFGPDQLLHHEGRVGAEHDHLAVRHVDHAHDPERDGEQLGPPLE